MGDWLYLFVGRGALNGSSETRALLHTYTKKSERHPQRVWSSDSCFSVCSASKPVWQRKEIILKKKKKRQREGKRPRKRERDQSSSCQLQQGSPLLNILITSPPHYRCHVNEKGRKMKERTSSREEQFCNFLITFFLATFAFAVVNATNWMFLWFLSK